MILFKYYYERDNKNFLVKNKLYRKFAKENDFIVPI